MSESGNASYSHLAWGLHLIGEPVHLLLLRVPRVLVDVQQAPERAVVVLHHVQGLGLESMSDKQEMRKS